MDSTHEENYKTLTSDLYDILGKDMPGGFFVYNYEATRLIRAMGRKDTALVPIIALSANARDEDKRMSMESGMDSHVAKPFDMNHLLQTIHSYIGENRKYKM